MIVVFSRMSSLLHAAVTFRLARPQRLAYSANTHLEDYHAELVGIAINFAVPRRLSKC